MRRLSTICTATIGLAANTLAAPLDLANLNDSTTILDGATLTGTLSCDYKICIEEGATVTLSSVTIDRPHNSSYRWAGLTCLGDATLILEGDNTVNGFYAEHPGILAAPKSTLTIRGSGSLTAQSGGGQAAGIGGGYTNDVGNIVIEGGTITANGGFGAAGIGGGMLASCGNITISGGNITAIGGSQSAGIGSGSKASNNPLIANCGNIVITGGNVTATGGMSGAGIGASSGSTCGSIVISGGTVHATGGKWGAGIGSGEGGTCGVIAIKSGIACVTATKNDDLGELIGKGDDSSAQQAVCYGVAVDGELIDETVGSTRTIMPQTFIDLATVYEDITIDGRTILTGALNSQVKVSIADGAIVTLRDAAITNGVNSSTFSWAGLTCLGDATIILEGDNIVKGFYEDYPGIYVPVGSTLTITGDGSLDVSSQGYAAGIGVGYTGKDCGNIVINGGAITATGGQTTSAIGGGKNCYCGDITISDTVISVHAQMTDPGTTYCIGCDKAGYSGTVTVGGVTGGIKGYEYTYTGGMPNPVPEFGVDGKAATTEFVQSGEDKWTITAFAELSNDALGKDVAPSDIKVYAASTVEGLGSAEPMASGVEVKERKSAVKTTIEVTTPPEAGSQFFRVKFGQ